MTVSGTQTTLIEEKDGGFLIENLRTGYSSWRVFKNDAYKLFNHEIAENN